MRQFDIVRLRGRELVVLLQSDLLDERATRVVAPLLPKGAIKPTPRLHPFIRLGRRDYILATEKLSAVAAKDIKVRVGTAATAEYDIRRALDIVFTGV